MTNSNDSQAMRLQLTKSSTEEQLKQYFMGIVELSKSSDEFPVSLDDIWPLAYGRKEEAVRALTDEGSGFMQDIDYQVLRRNAERIDGVNVFAPQKCGAKKKGRGGHNRVDYYLSVSCAEYLVVRKVRSVFEVYRRVFHKVVNNGIDLLGLGKYYTIDEYCQMFGKSRNSFYGLMANYREEFVMIGSLYYISKSLCKMLELRLQVNQMRTSIREKADKRQLELQFSEQ